MKNYINTPRKRLMIQLINFIFYGLFFEYISNLYHVRKLKMSVLSFSSVKLSLSVGIGFEIMPICACACRNPSGFTFKKVFREIILARSNFLEKIFGCTTCDRSFQGWKLNIIKYYVARVSCFFEERISQSKNKKVCCTFF